MTHRWAIAAWFAIASVAIGAQSNTRDVYQRVINRYYPGFRIVPIADLEMKREARDGKRGSLIAGQFNADTANDFAAYIIPAKTTRFAGSPPYDYHAGKLVMCLGATGGGYKCEAQDRPFTLPVDSQLEIVPPGRYACYGGAMAVTTIASVGEASEKGGGLYVRNRDGSIRLCITAD